MRVFFVLLLVLPQVLSIVWANWEANSAGAGAQFCQLRCNKVGKEKAADCLNKCHLRQNALANRAKPKKVRN